MIMLKRSFWPTSLTVAYSLVVSGKKLGSCSIMTIYTKFPFIELQILIPRFIPIYFILIIYLRFWNGQLTSLFSHFNRIIKYLLFRSSFSSRQKIKKTRKDRSGPYLTANSLINTTLIPIRLSR